MTRIPQETRDYIRKHYQTMTDGDLALKCGMNKDSIRWQRREMCLHRTNDQHMKLLKIKVKKLWKTKGQ